MNTCSLNNTPPLRLLLWTLPRTSAGLGVGADAMGRPGALGASVSNSSGLLAADFGVNKEPGFMGLAGELSRAAETPTAWQRGPKGDRLMRRGERAAGSCELSLCPSERKGLWPSFPNMWATPDDDRKPR